MRRAARQKSLLHPLSRLAGDFRERIRRGLRVRGHALQPAHSSVLIHLKGEGRRLTELAESAGITKQAMGKLVDELEQIGYVERVPDRDDGRAKIVRFSKKGRALLRDSGQIVDTIWDDYAALVGEPRLARLRDTLHLLLERIDAEAAPGTEGKDR
ncbi:MAG: MarR family winged helix-turn-helix transcriptional regulator [Myxococcota bacterium]